jgi:hypothetical protein
MHLSCDASSNGPPKFKTNYSFAPINQQRPPREKNEKNSAKKESDN